MPVPIPCCFHLCFLKVVCPSVGPDTLPGVLQMEPPSSFMSALDTIFFQLNTCLALVGTSLGEKKEIGMGRKENVGGFGEEATGESGVPGGMRTESSRLTSSLRCLMAPVVQKHWESHSGPGRFSFRFLSHVDTFL